MAGTRRRLLSSSLMGAVVIELPLLVWWWALRPGGWSPDSLSSWSQVRGAPWSDHHPPPFTAFIWLVSAGGRWPGAVSLVQTLIVAVALATFCRVVGGRLRARPVMYAGAVVLAALPLVGPFSVVVWKDVLETSLLMLLAAVVLQASERPPGSRRRLTVVFALSLLAASIRWNGVATLVVAAVVVGATGLSRGRWRLPVTVAAGGVIGFALLTALPVLADVEPLPAVDTKAQQLADLAQFARHTPIAIDAADRAVMERVAPFSAWARAGYRCDTLDPVTYSLIRYGHRELAVEANAAALGQVWQHAALRAKGELVSARLCRSALAWNPRDAPGRSILTVWTRVNSNKLGLGQSGPTVLRKAAVSYADVDDRRWVQELAWRPAGWILLAAVVGFVLRGGRRLAVLLALPLGVVVSYAASPAAQDARYTYAAVVMCQLLALGYVWQLIARRPRSSDHTTGRLPALDMRTTVPQDIGVRGPGVPPVPSR